MGYREIFTRINAGTVGGILIFHGPEEYVKDRTMEALKAKLVQPGMEDLNYQYMEGERANAADIRRAAETLPFMAEKRLVVVRDYPMLASTHRGSGLDTKQEAAELELLTRRFPETTCLVFLQRVAVDTTKAAWKQLIKVADAVEFAVLKDDELITQLAKMVKRADCTVTSDTARFMIQYCGADLETLSNEMAKACAYAGPGSTISRADVEAVCVQTQESKIFQFIDSLFAGQGREAMQKLRAMTEDADGAGAMISLIERQARLLSAVKAAGKGSDARTLAGLLGAPPFAVEAAQRQSGRWTGTELAQIVSMCVKADLSIKQGVTQDQTAVEQLAMNVVYMAANRK
jgi:DNA polymerase III subunit delta